MQHALGCLILFVVVAVMLWGAWNLWRPRKRQRGMRINISPAEPGKPDPDE